MAIMATHYDKYPILAIHERFTTDDYLRANWLRYGL